MDVLVVRSSCKVTECSGILDAAFPIYFLCNCDDNSSFNVGQDALHGKIFANERFAQEGGSSASMAHRRASLRRTGWRSRCFFTSAHTMDDGVRSGSDDTTDDCARTDGLTLLSLQRGAVVLPRIRLALLLTGRGAVGITTALGSTTQTIHSNVGLLTGSSVGLSLLSDSAQVGSQHTIPRLRSSLLRLDVDVVDDNSTTVDTSHDTRLQLRSPTQDPTQTGSPSHKTNVTPKHSVTLRRIRKLTSIM